MTITDLPTGFGIADEDLPLDTTPPASDVEYPCEVCGREAGPYGGRGRKPKRCTEHKSSGRSNTRSAPGAKGTNATLAQQATEALWQINGMVAFLAMIAQFPLTATAIQDREVIFREMCYNALLTDPNMCRFILKGGTQSAKMSLFLCYGMFAAGIGPAFMSEIKEKRAAKEALTEEFEV